LENAACCGALPLGPLIILAPKIGVSCLCADGLEPVAIASSIQFQGQVKREEELEVHIKSLGIPSSGEHGGHVLLAFISFNSAQRALWNLRESTKEAIFRS
jgi:hypothetical protein